MTQSNGSFLFDSTFNLDKPLPEHSFLNDVDLSNMQIVFAAFQANTLYQNAKILAKNKPQRLTIQYDHNDAVLRMWINGNLMYKAQLFKERFDAT